MLGVVRRCCINIVNSLNLLYFQVCDEKRKLLNVLEFSGIMQQRLYFSYSRYRKVFGLFAISHCNFTQHYWPIVTKHISPVMNPFSQGGEKKMNTRWVLCLCILVGGLLVGCSNPQKRSAAAQAVIDEQKAEIMKDYRACLKKYHKPEEHEVCERYKGVIDAF